MTTFTLWVLITLWVVCGVLSAVAAKSKGRSIMGWLALGFLLGVLGPIVVALLPAKPASQPVATPEDVPERLFQEPRHPPEGNPQQERDREKVEEFALYVIVGLAALGVIIWVIATFAA